MAEINGEVKLLLTRDLTTQHGNSCPKSRDCFLLVMVPVTWLQPYPQMPRIEGRMVLALNKNPSFIEANNLVIKPVE